MEKMGSIQKWWSPSSKESQSNEIIFHALPKRLGIIIGPPTLVRWRRMSRNVKFEKIIFLQDISILKVKEPVSTTFLDKLCKKFYQ